MNLDKIRAEVTKPENITFALGFYRYVDHKYRLASTGFGSAEALINYTLDLRFDARAILIMQDRYTKL